MYPLLLLWHYGKILDLEYLDLNLNPTSASCCLGDLGHFTFSLGDSVSLFVE